MLFTRKEVFMMTIVPGKVPRSAGSHSALVGHHFNSLSRHGINDDRDGVTDTNDNDHAGTGRHGATGSRRHGAAFHRRE